MFSLAIYFGGTSLGVPKKIRRNLGVPDGGTKIQKSVKITIESYLNLLFHTARRRRRQNRVFEPFWSDSNYENDEIAYEN